MHAQSMCDRQCTDAFASAIEVMYEQIADHLLCEEDKATSEAS
jgi:hypothetical protein